MATQAGSRPGHPTIPNLALYAGGDLPWLRTFRVQRHLSQCEDCEGIVARIRASSNELRREAESETLTGFEAIADWHRLEAEMLGNISVGLAAVRCVEPSGKQRDWRIAAMATTVFALLFAMGWWTHIPPEQTARIAAALRLWAGGEAPGFVGTRMQSLPDGVSVNAGNSTLTMRHPRSASVSISGGSAMEARFVDEDTGQVTISTVYGQ